jgi:hypothetical protein
MLDHHCSKMKKKKRGYRVCSSGYAATDKPACKYTVINTAVLSFDGIRHLIGSVAAPEQLLL